MDDALSHLHEGVPWWKVKFWPGTRRRLGGEPRLAAYLYFNVEVGEIFRMRDLRMALGDDVPESAEHLNRRLRRLREEGWQIPSYKDRAGLEQDEYLLEAKGNRLWLGERNKRSAISAAVRRYVLERDFNRCVICGVGAGEPYPDEPGSLARMTIGHRTAGARLADASADNLQSECARCNETVGDAPPDPETLPEVMAVVSKLGSRDKATLLAWLESGYRQRNKVDMAFDRIRRLSPSERSRVGAYLRNSIAAFGSPPGHQRKPS